MSSLVHHSFSKIDYRWRSDSSSDGNLLYAEFNRFKIRTSLCVNGTRPVATFDWLIAFDGKRTRIGCWSELTWIPLDNEPITPLPPFVVELDDICGTISVDRFGKTDADDDTGGNALSVNGRWLDESASFEVPGRLVNGADERSPSDAPERDKIDVWEGPVSLIEVDGNDDESKLKWILLVPENDVRNWERKNWNKIFLFYLFDRLTLKVTRADDSLSMCCCYSMAILTKASMWNHCSYLLLLKIHYHWWWI